VRRDVLVDESEDGFEFDRERVDAVLAVAACRDEAEFLEVLEVVGDVGLREAGRVDEFAHGFRSATKGVEEIEPPFVTESLEERRLGAADAVLAGAVRTTIA
jgi:hypothetical protein